MSSSADPEPELVCSEQPQGEGCKLVLAGELDVRTAPELEARLEAVIRQGGGDVTLDLRGLRFVDSTGLHGLLNAHRRLTRRDRRLQVICADGPVLRALELARLIETLGVRLDG